MTPVTTAEAKTAPAFPAGEIETRIRDFLAEEGAMQASLHRSEETEDSPSGEPIGPQPVIDSLVVVEVLVEVESEVPFDLPESVVRAGGYDSVDEVVEHLVPQLEKLWHKHHSEKK